MTPTPHRRSALVRLLRYFLSQTLAGHINARFELNYCQHPCYLRSLNWSRWSSLWRLSHPRSSGRRRLQRPDPHIDRVSTLYILLSALVSYLCHDGNLLSVIASRCVFYNRRNGRYWFVFSSICRRRHVKLMLLTISSGRNSEAEIDLSKL